MNSSASSARRLILSLVNCSLAVALLFVSSLSLAGFFSAQDQACELLSHFRIIWTIVLTGLVVALVLVKQRKFAIVGAVILVLNLADVLRIYVPEKDFSHTGAGSTIKILVMNVSGDSNFNYTPVLSLINDTDPDLIGLSEVNGAWVKELDSKLAAYPFRMTVAKSDGMALYSRLPLSDTETRLSKLAHRPRFLAHLRLGGEVIGLDFAHPLLPVIPKLRNEELDEIGQEAQRSDVPIIVFGDLNCTPWSHYFDKLLNDGKLHDSERGFGPQATWNALWLLPVLPIDHCLISSRFRTVERHTGPAIGSDHLPVVIELELE